MKKSVVIVAGGSGLRMGSRLPKQFIPIAGKPVLMWTMEKFYNYDPELKIILVLPLPQVDEWKKLCLTYNFAVQHQLAGGGETRFHSARNGFQMTEEKSLVAIHDGVRPLVSWKTIAGCYSIAAKKGNAVPCVEVADSIRQVDSNGSHIVPREGLRIIQTPQVFRHEQLLHAYSENYDPEFTDDAAAVERAGYKIHLVEGNKENLKLTTREDLIVAEGLLKGNLVQ